jgi:hypothetical protein
MAFFSVFRVFCIVFMVFSRGVLVFLIVFRCYYGMLVRWFGVCGLVCGIVVRYGGIWVCGSVLLGIFGVYRYVGIYKIVI